MSISFETENSSVHCANLLPLRNVRCFDRLLATCALLPRVTVLLLYFSVLCLIGSLELLCVYTHVCVCVRVCVRFPFSWQAYQTNFVAAGKAVLDVEFFQFDLAFCDSVTESGLDVIVKVRIVIAATAAVAAVGAAVWC